MTTVVFADLVGSTSLYERLGDASASQFVTGLVGLHSQVFEQHSGRVVKLLGDGLFVVFTREGDALAASIQIQKQLLDTPLRPSGDGPLHCRGPMSKSRLRPDWGRVRWC